MKQHAQENAPASVQHFYPPLLPSVTLSSSIFRSIFVFASSFCPLIDASPFVYKREPNRWFYIISLPTLIFFLSLLLFVFNLSYSIHVRCNFKNFNSRVRIVSFLSSRNINDSTININHLYHLQKSPKSIKAIVSKQRNLSTRPTYY